MNLLDASTFLLKSAATSATPLLLAGTGELLAERAGIINIGIEGIMLMGAIAAYATLVLTASLPLAVIAATLMGILFILLFAFVTLAFRADQVVTGTALNILAFGTSTTLWHALQNTMSASSHPAPTKFFEPLPIPLLSKIPLLGPSLFTQYTLFYAVIALMLATAALLHFTRIGLIIRALGDAPDACNAAGLRVRLWRLATLLFAGACAGTAGSYLSTMRNHSFQINMTGGQGFLVLALVIFGRWKFSGLLLGIFFFALLDALQSLLAAIPQATTRFPHQLFDMLPYLATLLALAALSRTRAAPLTLGIPYPPDR